MSSSYYFGNLSFDEEARADEERQRVEAEAQRVAEAEMRKYVEAGMMNPFVVTDTKYDTNNPYDNQLRLGDNNAITNPFSYDNPYQGPAPTPPPVSLGGGSLPQLPVTTDPTVIGAIDPKTGLPYRHSPDPVPLTKKDIHPTNPMGPSNPTVYGAGQGGLLGSGIDIGIPGLITAGSLLSGGLSGSTGGGGGTSGGSGNSGNPQPPTQQNPPVVVPPVTTGNVTRSPTANKEAPVATVPVAPTTSSTKKKTPKAPAENPPAVTVPPVVIPPPVTPPPAETPPKITVPPVITPPPQAPAENPPVITLPPIIPTPPPVTPPVVPPVVPPSTPPPAQPPPTTPVPTTPLPLPLDRNYYREGSQTNQDNTSLLPGIFQNYANTSRSYGGADQANFSALLQSLGIDNSMLTGFANQQTAAGNTALRTGNVADASALGGQALGVLQGLNPNMYGALNQTNTAAGGTGQPSDIQMMLEQQAREGLALGGQLSSEDNRLAQQAAREAWSARGLVNSPGAVADEVLNRDSLSRQRLAERQALASSVDQQGFSQRQQGYGNQIQNSLLQMQGAFNPFETITSANTTNQGSNQQLFNQGAGFSSGAFGNQNVNQLVNPFSPYAQDVYSTNTNAANARFISQGNNAAALAGARDAASGDIANSFLRLIGGLYGAS